MRSSHHPSLSQFVLWFTFQNESIGINLSCPQFPSTTESRLHVTRNNEMIEYPITNRDKSNIFELMDELVNEIKEVSSDSTTHAKDIATFHTIFEQLKAIEGEYPYKLSTDYQTITFSEIPDHRGHYLELHYDRLRNAFQLQRHSLPQKCGTLKGRTLAEYLENFRSELGILEEFYGNLSDIDELCFVIAPVPVTTKEAYRIFKFSE